jgi:predicted nucleic acid-binding protein
MRKVVVDASAIVALYLPEGDSDAVEEALRRADSVATLDLAFYEAANALWKHVRRGDMEPGRAEAVLGEILEFLRSVEVHAYGEVAHEGLQEGGGPRRDGLRRRLRGPRRGPRRRPHNA